MRTEHFIGNKIITRYTSHNHWIFRHSMTHQVQAMRNNRDASNLPPHNENSNLTQTSQPLPEEEKQTPPPPLNHSPTRTKQKLTYSPQSPSQRNGSDTPSPDSPNPRPPADPPRTPPPDSGCSRGARISCFAAPSAPRATRS